jgi:hypothetical protein
MRTYCATGTSGCVPAPAASAFVRILTSWLLASGRSPATCRFTPLAATLVFSGFVTATAQHLAQGALRSAVGSAAGKGQNSRHSVILPKPP